MTRAHATPRSARWRAALAAAAAGVFTLAAALAWLPPAPRPLGRLSAAPTPPGVQLALFALGDTGDRHWLASLREGQLAVARGLLAEDLRRPVDALLLLGDNFYPDGLRRAELVERVRANLVWPYCRFAELRGPRSHEVAEACTLEPALRRPVPIYAVLGNHDYTEAESPQLQRSAVPDFVSNWHLPAGPASAVELPAGVSLVLIDSPSLERESDAEALASVLRGTKGPWRIAMAHHPLAPLEGGASSGRAARMRRAFAAAGVPFHLFLSGHRHNLQVIEGEAPDPALHVIAGSGSTRKPVETPYARRRFAAAQTGFVRVELLRRGAGQGLAVTLYTTPRYPAEFWWNAREVSRWWVERSGHVWPEPLERPGPPLRR